MAFVVTLENILLGDVPENCDGLVKDGIYFCIGFLMEEKSATTNQSD
jgi:hypothetical protein